MIHVRLKPRTRNTQLSLYSPGKPRRVLTEPRLPEAVEQGLGLSGPKPEPKPRISARAEPGQRWQYPVIILANVVKATPGFISEDTALRAVACLKEGRNRLNVVENVYRRRLGNFFVHVIFVQQNHTFGEVRAGFASF